MRYLIKSFFLSLFIAVLISLGQSSVANDLKKGKLKDKDHIVITGECADNSQFDYPFQNPDLSFEERVNDLVGRLTLEEKIGQMMHNAPAIDRLGISRYNWWNECLHGVGRSGINVTVFPQAIGMAATFDDEALLKMAAITSDEARAIHHESNRTGQEGQQYRGLTFWTPNINIFRDPRWGRGQETYGEDPYLTTQMGKAMVRGLQGDDPNYLKVSACAKHFAVHSGPEPGRNKFDVAVNTCELWDTYLPAFEALVTEANVSSVMCAYNRYDGQPCCGNDLLMMDILRNQWEFDGYVTSDCGAINDFFANHKTHPNPASAAADAVLHGTDLECGGVYRNLAEAVKNKQITEDEIDVSVKRLFMTRMKLGMFDPEGIAPYSDIPMSVVESKGNKEHALKMARESMVLLRNNKKFLPLSPKIKKVLVMGPNANNEEILLGNYNGVPSETITPFEAIKAKNQIEVSYVQGTSYVNEDKDMEAEALASIKNADLVIFVGGISPRLEGEEGDAGKDGLDGFIGGDRTNIALPAIQTEMMKKVKAAGKPLVFVCMSGSAIGFEWEAQNADAIIQAWYGGQSAGTAVADVIFGDYNPAGRLPLTFYRNLNDLPPIEDYSMTNSTYRYYNGEVLYPFGFGLSYTDFDYKWGSKPKSIYTENETISFSVKIRNAGKLDGDEVVQAYIKYPEEIGLPKEELREFKRLNLRVGDEKEVTMTISVNDLKKWNEVHNEKELIKGEYSLFIGGNSADSQLSFDFKVAN
ncbi:beta-glucosidase [Draconibacterium orientale]|uniref:Beta-glucosidase n=1 Tax=Draconibacterium orientale TaxID=1168034 RepID=X5DZC3_9BACT|nr:glycoside hydrolase family 3 C-terminal domain-containing protein [Draconibacterium orientale]AHW60590.1 glycoside hydrolase family 3 [Draconibacterium orientale]SET04305.1 beta-glucosidase [Draconibacterium orientale]